VKSYFCTSICSSISELGLSLC